MAQPTQQGDQVDLVAWAQYFADRYARDYVPATGNSDDTAPWVTDCQYYSSNRAACFVWVTEWVRTPGNTCAEIFNPSCYAPPDKLDHVAFRDTITAYVVPSTVLDAGIAQEVAWDPGRYNLDQSTWIYCSDDHRRGAASCQPDLYP